MLLRLKIELVALKPDFLPVGLSLAASLVTGGLIWLLGG